MRERLRTQFESSFGTLERTVLKPGTPAASAPHAPTGRSADPFPGLAAGQFAAYGSAVVNHTGAAASDDEKVARDVNLAAAHAAHTGSALPRWDNEVRRAAFPALAAGSSHGKALAAELGPPDEDEENSELPLDPAVAQAPPSSEAAEDDTPIDVPPVLKNKALRAQAAARASRSGCVLGSDLAMARANADDTSVGDVKNDPKSPEPFLSLNSDTPQRGVSQSLARARLIPLPDQPNRFGVMAETRQTFAPVTFFKGESSEITIEIAGEWILRAIADGTKGTVTLGVEKSENDDRPLLRIITREGKNGKPLVTTVADLDEVRLLERGGFTLPNGLTIVLAEDPRALRSPTATSPEETGVRAAGALDILRVQATDNPDDAVARIGHMEAAVAVPSGGATCPGIALTKKSSQPTVDAGARFSWLLNVSNPNGCILDRVRVVDSIQPSAGLVYKVVASSPQAKVDGNTVTFDAIGPLPSGASRSLRIDVEVDPGSAPGRFTNQAVATGECGSEAVSGSAEDETEVEPSSPLALVGQGSANEPAVAIPSHRASQGSRSGAPPAPAPGVVVRPAPDRSTLNAGAAAVETRRNPAAGLPSTGGPLPGLLRASIFLLGIGAALRCARPRHQRQARDQPDAGGV